MIVPKCIEYSQPSPIMYYTGYNVTNCSLRGEGYGSHDSSGFSAGTQLAAGRTRDLDSGCDFRTQALSASQPLAWPGFLIILIHIWCQIKPHPACAPALTAPSRPSQWRRACDGKGFGWSFGRDEKFTCGCEDGGGGWRVRMEWRKNSKVIAEILWQTDTSIPPWYQSLLYA